LSTVTPNFNWPVPTSTDLVKDGATAIEALGDSIDASLVDLKGGTTGQVLSKTSNTDMDFTWVAQDDSNAIQNSIVDAKGDLIAASANDTPARLAVGSNGETLVADSSTSTGLRYQVPVNVNPILNSNFTIWQRGTSFAAPAAGAYLADRWNVGNAGGAGRTYSRQTASLDGFQYCIRGQRDSGNTGTGIIAFSQSLETINSIPYQGKTVMVSFYARAGADYSAASNGLGFTLATGTGTDQKRLIGDPTTYTGNSSVLSGSVTLTTSWQRFTLTATTLATNATEIAFGFQHTPVGTAGAADYFEVTGVQLEVGNVATPYKSYAGTIQGELAACQRYYERFSSATSGFLELGQSTGRGSGQADFMIRFATTKRVKPTAVDYGGTMKISNYYGATELTVSSLILDDPSSIWGGDVLMTLSSSATAGTRYMTYFANNSTSYLGFSSEL